MNYLSSPFRCENEVRRKASLKSKLRYWRRQNLSTSISSRWWLGNNSCNLNHTKSVNSKAFPPDFNTHRTQIINKCNDSLLTKIFCLHYTPYKLFFKTLTLHILLLQTWKISWTLIRRGKFDTDLKSNRVLFCISIE